MANSLTAFNPEYWAREMQVIFFKESTALVLANTELRALLSDGDTVNKPYRSYLADQAYTKGTDISTFNDLTATNEQLVVDTTRVVPFYVDDIDKIQNKWDTASRFARDAQRVLNNKLDQVVLGQYSNASSFVAAQELGGSGTGSYQITAANISNIFTAAARKLDNFDVPQSDRVFVIGPRLLEILRQSVSGRETGFGESVSANGVIGNRFGFQLILSNNIPFTATLTNAGIATDADTLTINGVVFTWEATGANCDSAGEVDLGANADAGYANMVLAINGTATPTTSTYFDVSATDRKRLLKHGITASYNSGTDILTVTGFGDVEIAESTDNLTITTNEQYPVAMIRGAVDLVTQKSPSVEFRLAEKRLGRYVYPWMMYGIKTFQDMKDAIVYVKVDTSSWV